MRKVLVVDNAPEIGNMLVNVLSRSGYYAELVLSGEDAVEMCKMDKYDLVFLDLSMNGLSGIDTLRKIREQDEDLPVYFTTGFYYDCVKELKSLVEERINFELLSKPYGENQVLAVVKNVIPKTMEY